MVNKFRAQLLTLPLLLITAVVARQTPAQPTEKQGTPGLVKLTGDDEKRATQLNEQVETALKADRWDEAIARAEELLALRKRVQGPKHYETVDVEWLLKALRRVAPMRHTDRVAYQSGKTLSLRASDLDAQRNYAQAQPLFEKALEIDRRLLTDDHPDTAKSYNNLAWNLNAQGKYLQAQPLYEKALALKRRLLTEDHPSTATAYENLAMNLDAQGRYAQAQPLFEKVLEINHRLLGDDHIDTANSYDRVASGLWRQGQYAAAQPLFEKALEIKRRLLTDNHVETANSYNNLALNLDALGKYAEARALHEKALEIDRRQLTDDDPSIATDYSSLAINYQSEGNYAAALPLNEKALEINRRLLSDDNPRTARSYNNLAANLWMQGNFAAAQPLNEKALEIRRALLGDDHPDTAESYHNLAINLSYQGKFAQAQPLLEKALEIQRRRLTDDHPDTVTSFIGVAFNLKAQGNHAAARPLYEKALEICRRRLSDNHPLTAGSYTNLASNFIARGEYAAAQPLHEKALEIRLHLLSDDHPDVALSYNRLASNLNARGKYPEARDRWRSAVKSLDAARLRFAFTGLERVGTEESVRPALAAVLARLGQPAEAWEALEDDLGRGLLDELAARRDSWLALSERTRLHELTTALERLDRLVETTPQGLDQAERAKRFEDLKRQRALASIALGEFQAKLVQDHGARAGHVAKLNEIEAALPADAALLAWVDLKPAGPHAADPDGEHWGVVVRSRGIPVWIPITGTGPNGLWIEDDTALADRVRTVLQRRPGAGSADLQPLVERFRAQRLASLAKALAATADGLPPVRRLIVLPSRAMARLPVESLLAPDDTRIVSYVPSATVFKYLREQPRPDHETGLLALGDPAYEHPDKSHGPELLPDHGLLVNVVTSGSNAATHGLKPGDVLLAYNGQRLDKKDDLKIVAEGEKPIGIVVWRDGHSSPRSLAPGKLGVVLHPRPAPEAIAGNRAINKVLAAARGGDGDFIPLPGTHYEVEAISRLFKAHDRTTRVLLGTDASEPEIDRLAGTGELGRFGFIHLATHGVIDESIPQRSAVILTQINLPDPLTQVLNHKPAYDGRLSVREIQRTWNLMAELVTLSACETALGRDAGGEGFVGFTQALLMSGARSVCLSLWKVDDTATALLMQRFYANLLGVRTGLSEPLPKAEALAEAKAWLRGLSGDEVAKLAANLSGGEARAKGATKRRDGTPAQTIPAGHGDEHPYDHPYFWAAFVLVGDPD
jgi:tetratricopeptide (TPR) repeat protein